MQKTQEVAPEAIYVLSEEAMQLLHISRRTLERWVADGTLPFIRTAGRGPRRYLKSDIDILLSGERIAS